jgi:hypothetical protein
MIDKFGIKKNKNESRDSNVLIKISSKKSIDFNNENKSLLQKMRDSIIT